MAAPTLREETAHEAEAAAPAPPRIVLTDEQCHRVAALLRLPPLQRRQRAGEER